MSDPNVPPDATTDLPVRLPDSGEYPFLRPPEQPGGAFLLGPYRVLGVLGRGGMGVVFDAEDPHLDRRVALKALLPEVAGNPAARARFVREARLQAKVQHDHVAAIFQVGEDAGTPFLAMPLLKGLTLNDALKANPRPPLPEAVRIAREVAEGLAAAHAVGLIHRDIKPGNVWLEAPRLRVKILDFGLARLSDEGAGGGELVTRAGAIVGTPAYMSPEQAWGNPVDHRTDLFALGVVLYEMCAGERPFAGKSPLEIITRLTVEEPIPVAEKNPAVPSLLTGLVGRLLAKGPAARPATAVQVADELQQIEASLRAGVRVVPHGPLPTVVPVAVAAPSGPDPFAEIDATLPNTVMAAPVRPPTPRWMWPAVALASVATAAALAVIIAIALPNRKKPEAVVASADAPKPKPVYLPPKKDADKQTLPREVRSIALPAPVTWTALSPDEKTVAAGGEDGAIYLIDLATLTVRTKHPGHTGAVAHVAFSSDGAWVASGGRDDRAVRVWHLTDPAKHRALGRAAAITPWTVAFAPDGSVVACGSDVGWDPETGDVKRRYKRVLGIGVSPIPGTRRVVCGDDQAGCVRAFDSDTGEEVATASGLPRVRQVAVSPGGARVAAAVQPEGPATFPTVRLFATPGLTPVSKLEGLVLLPLSIGWSAAGRVVTAGEEGANAHVVRVWDEYTGKEVSVLRGPAGPIQGVAITLDGRTVVSGSNDRTVRVWELPPPPPLPREVRSITLPKSAAANGIALSPDGSALAVGGGDGTVYVFDPVSAKTLDTFPGHAGRVLAVAFSPDGQSLISGGHGNDVKLWDWSEKKRHRLLGRAKPGRDIWFIGFLDARTVAAGWPDAVWDVETGEEVPRFAGLPPGWARPIPNRDRVVVGGWPQTTLTLADAKTGDPVGRLALSGAYRGAAPSPDGKFLAVAVDGNPNGLVEVWDWAAAKVVARLTGHIGVVFAVVYSPRGDWVATVGHDGTARVYDVVSSRVVAVLQGHTAPLFGAAFGLDGRTLYTSAADGTVRVWALPAGPVENGQQWAVLPDGSFTLGLALTADGKLGAVGMGSGHVILFDPADGRTLATLPGQGHHLTFSADGRWLAAAGAGTGVKVFDVRKRTLHREWTKLQERCIGVAFAPAGDLLVAHGSAVGWDPETGAEKVRFDSPLGSVLGFVGKDRLFDHRKAEVWVWDPSTGKRSARTPVDGAEPWRLAVSPDRARFAVAAGDRNGDWKTPPPPGSDFDAWVRDAATGKAIHRLTGHENTVMGVAYSPDGTRIATAAADMTVRVWDADSGRAVAVLRGHTGEGLSVVFTPDGRAVLSAGLDGTVRLWRLPAPPDR